MTVEQIWRRCLRKLSRDGLEICKQVQVMIVRAYCRATKSNTEGERSDKSSFCRYIKGKRRASPRAIISDVPCPNNALQCLKWEFLLLLVIESHSTKLAPTYFDLPSHLILFFPFSPSQPYHPIPSSQALFIPSIGVQR